MCSTGRLTFATAHWNSPFLFLQPKSLHRHTLSSRWPATPADWSATAVNCCLRNSPGNSTHDRRLHRGRRSSPYSRVLCFWAAVVYSRLRCRCPYRWRRPTRGNQMNSKCVVAVACFGCHVVCLKYLIDLLNDIACFCNRVTSVFNHISWFDPVPYFCDFFASFLSVFTLLWLWIYCRYRNAEDLNQWSLWVKSQQKVISVRILCLWSLYIIFVCYLCLRSLSVVFDLCLWSSISLFDICFALSLISVFDLVALIWLSNWPLMF